MVNLGDEQSSDPGTLQAYVMLEEGILVLDPLQARELQVRQVLKLLWYATNLAKLSVFYCILHLSFGYILQNQMQGLCILLICHYCWLDIKL
jgi:hypothetical protein